MLITPKYLPNVGGVQVVLYNVCKRLPSEEIIVMRSRHPLIDSKIRSFNASQHYKIIENKYFSPSPNPRYDLDPFEQKEFARKSIWNRLFLKSRILRILYFLLSFVTSLYAIKKHKVNMVWCGYPSTRFLIMSLLARCFLGVPYFVHTYGEELPKLYERSTFFSSIEGFVKMMGLKKSSRVYALSSFGRDCLLKAGLPDSKIITRNPGIDISDFREDPIEEAKIKEKYGLVDKKVILSVGNVTERKGIDIIVKLLPDLIKKVPNLIYMVVGEFTDDAYFKKIKIIISENNLDDRVILVGKVPVGQLAHYYYISNVFCLATRENQEGFGMVFIEANACKKPVVGFATGGVSDAIINGETGLLVKFGDINQFKNSLITLLTNEKYATELGEKGFKRAEFYFSWDKYAKDIQGEMTKNNWLN